MNRLHPEAESLSIPLEEDRETTLSILFRKTRQIWWALPLIAMTFLSGGCAWLASVRAHAADAAAQAYEPLYFEAQLALEGGDAQGAIKKLEPLRDRPDCPPEIFTALAEAYLKDRRTDAGLATLDECLKRYPEFVPAWQARAKVNRSRGDAEKAIADLESALKIEPQNSGVLEELGLLLLRNTRDWATAKGESDPAVAKIIDVYTRMLKIRAGSDRILPLLVLNSVYSRVGSMDKAVEAAKEAVKLRAQDIRGHLALAETYEASKQPKEALEAYRQAMLIEPGNAAIRAKVAELVKQTGRQGGLLSFYEEMAQSFPRVLEIQESYGDELLKAKQWNKAAEHYQNALKLWPESRKFRLALIQADFLTGKVDESMKLVSALVADPSLSDSEMLDLASTLRKAGKLEEVIELLKRVAAAHPEESRLPLQLAGVQVDAGKNDEAIKTLQGLLAKKPDEFLAVAMLGGLYTDAGRFKEAHDVYDRASASVPKERAMEFLLLRAELARREGKSEDAIKLLEEAMGNDGKVPDVAVQVLIELYASTGAFDRAHALVDKTIAKGGEDRGDQARWLKAWLYSRARDYPKAIGILEEMHAAAPQDFKIVRSLIENYTDAGKFEQAQGLLDASRKIVEAAFATDLELLQANLYKEQRKYAEALSIVEKLIAGNDTEERFYLIAGEYYHDAGRNNDAERVLRKAIEINPRDAEAYNALGYFFAESDIKLDEAKTLVEKALELNPNAGHILDSLGWVYYKQGDFGKAVQTLESAIGKMTNTPDPTVLEHLGDAYSKSGNGTKARTLWENALKLNPKAEGLKEKLKQ